VYIFGNVIIQIITFKCISL